MNKQFSDMHLHKKQDIREECKKYNINTDINNRWENGIDHHPKSEALYKLIADVDFIFGNDYFCWKGGGDGDNGEALMYELDIIFELEDAKNKVK